jgi:hypothetical protein
VCLQARVARPPPCIASRQMQQSAGESESESESVSVMVASVQSGIVSVKRRAHVIRFLGMLHDIVPWNVHVHFHILKHLNNACCSLEYKNKKYRSTGPQVLHILLPVSAHNMCSLQTKQKVRICEFELCREELLVPTRAGTLSTYTFGKQILEFEKTKTQVHKSTSPPHFAPRLGP